jgi:phosphatidylglycerol:prolipoprotein diacylglycerol transferase
VDTLSRHPSQLYEALLEGIILFLILNILIFKKKYKIGSSSCLFLIFYGIFRVISEIFREPDAQVGYLFSLFSMGTILSFFMIISGFVVLGILKKNEI